MTNTLYNKDAFAFIFARGGSKGLPNKNLLRIGDHSLTGWSIHNAKKLPYVSKIFLSTDSSEIAFIGHQYGVEIINRPAELASDNAPEWLAWQHAVKYALDKYGMFDSFISLPPTAPLRRIQDIDKAYYLRDETCDISLIVTPSSHNPWFNMVVKNDDNAIDLICKQSIYNRRQDAPDCFEITTVAYCTTPQYIQNSSGIWNGKVKAAIAPREFCIDIDSELDYNLASLVYERMNNHE